jgi:hypothetical protein
MLFQLECYKIFTGCYVQPCCVHVHIKTCKYARWCHVTVLRIHVFLCWHPAL